MSKEQHALSIRLEFKQGTPFMYIEVTGKLTHKDYEIITPMVEHAIESAEAHNIRLFFDATALTGWEPEAAWDDLKLGIDHSEDFEKIALVGDKRWQAFLVKAGQWFLPGEMEYFKDKQEALSWLDAP